MHATGSVILLYGNGSVGKSSISSSLKNFFTKDDDVVFLSVDEISWAPLIKQAKILNLINDSMSCKEQYHIMMQHIDMLNDACDAQWIEYLKQFYNKVKELALKHKYVVVDTIFYVDGDEDTQYFLQLMKNISVFYVLVYAPRNIVAQRIVERNLGIDENQKRDVYYAMASFADLYIPALDRGLYSLHKEELEQSLKIIENYWLESGMPSKIVQVKITQLRELYREKFFTNESNFVNITSRLPYDLAVNSANLSPDQCAQIIYEKFIQL